MHRLTALIILLLLLTSCSNGNDSSPQSSNTIKSTQTEFRINNENIGLSYTDFDEINLLCKSFLEEFYHETLSKEKMNAEPYVNNDNLKKYILQKIETGSKGSIRKIKKLDFGIADIEWHLEEGYIFVELVAEVEQEIGGFSEGHQFLISNKGGRLFILDWYSKSSGNVSYLDEIARGNVDKINNPNIWNDKKWVNNLFEIIGNRGSLNKVKE